MFDISIKETLGIITILIVISQVYLYFRSIVRWETKLHVYTKLIWLILTWIGFIIQMQAWGWPWAWVLWATSLTQFVSILLWLKYGISSITKFDTCLLVLALLCIPVYLWVEDKIYALIFVIFIDFLWYIPTYRKTFQNPYTENILVWCISNTKYFIAMLALTQYSFYTLAYPMFLFWANMVLIGIMYFWRKNKKNPQ